MSSPWTAPRAGALFGYMHEDTAVECSLLPGNGRALCVLSAGDMAFELLRAGAATVVAADPNPAQHELVRWKLNQAAEGGRNTASGLIDRRLQWLARWVAPLVFPRSVQQAGAETLARHFKTLRWRGAWGLLGAGITLAFPLAFRRHLPGDVVTRLRCRFEAATLSQAGDPGPWLQRMLCQRPEDVPHAWASALPDAGMKDDQQLIVCPTLLHETQAGTSFDLVAASNILDTAPASDLISLLEALAPQVKTGGWCVLRSLFREANEWPPPPPGWEVDDELTRRLLRADLSPLCRVSVVLRRTGHSSSSAPIAKLPAMGSVEWHRSV